MTNPFDENPEHAGTPEEPVSPEQQPIIHQDSVSSPEEANPFYRDNMGGQSSPAEPRQPAPPFYGTQQIPPVPPQNTYSGFYMPPRDPAYPGNFDGKPPKRKKNTGVIVFIALLCLAILAGIIGLVVALSSGEDEGDAGGTKQPSSSQQDGSAPSLKSENSPTPPGNKKDSDELTAVGVADKVKNSMVGITAYNAQSGFSDFGSGSSQGGSTAGEGSGVLISEGKDGYSYIVTCAHVISGSGYSFKVELANGEAYNAEVVGYDSQTDIGVLRVKKTGLSYATFGDSDALKAGQQVIAIGNPGGSAFFGSVTQGIISAIDRPIDSQIGYTTKCIQHDAAINPGNSGGGLFNMYGQLIGINSSKISSTAYEGMGFAVPSSTVKTVINDLIAKGYVGGRVMIGIEPRSLSTYQNYYKYVQAGVPKGAVVIANIFDESDLKNTQVQQYDIIAGINGKELDSTEVLNSVLTTCKVGDTVTLDIIRNENNQLKKFQVKCKLIENKG